MKKEKIREINFFPLFLAEERDDLQDTVRRLKMDLEEEKNRSQRLERSPFNPEEAEWETKKILDDYKFKLQKSEQDINTLQTNVRLFVELFQYGFKFHILY